MRILRASLLLLLLPGISACGSFGLLDDSLEIGVGLYRFAAFRINPENADRPRIDGWLSVEPDTASIEILLFHVDDFERWASSGEDVDTLWFARTRADSVRIPLDGIGDYRLVLSNRGNYASVRVAADLSVEFSGSGVVEDPLISAFHVAAAMMALSVVVILVFGVARTLRRGGSRAR
ncbi:hypothetical protein JW921_02830 [Candidatus Fermentibacterales bacterium]|nr:hypothetical protein [Candidatus Fermentibacterales bacterium]